MPGAWEAAVCVSSTSNLSKNVLLEIFKVLLAAPSRSILEYGWLLPCPALQ